MSSWQKFVAALTVVCVALLLGPAAALANGPSAGDQQYIDPLSGKPSNSSTSTTPPATSTPTPSASSSPTPSSSTPATAPTATSSTASTSTATTPSTAPSAASDPTGKSTLPFTGFNVWIAAGLGLCMVGSGVWLRRVARRA